ncbi:MAG: hypothetical protein CSB47_09915 [Proteobacteria bacterium]|nr:MAG: hypothetical protein CSB47_09915 [Pseudomonadota bacterium]
MNVSKVLKYLISGIVVGTLLFFAGFGVVNMLNGPDQVVQVAAQQQPSAMEKTENSENKALAVEVKPPSIAVKPTNSTAQNGQGTRESPIKIKPIDNHDSTTTDSVETQTSDQSATFGTLTLSTANPLNGQPVMADFMIENSDGMPVALVKDTAKSTLSLPAGDYKITVTQGEAKLVRFLGVKAGQSGAEVFELAVPALAGEAAQPATTDQGAATTAQQTTPAANTDRPAATAGTKATAVPATRTQSPAMGGLRLSALTKVGNRPTNVSFYIQKLNGKNVKSVKGVSTQQFRLPAGHYRITARKGTARVVAKVKVQANRGVHKIFHMPSATGASAPTAAPAVRSATTASKASTPATTTQQPVTTTPAKDKAKTGRLELFSQTATSNKPIKSNFYIQNPAGKLVVHKTYVESIGYKLPSGKYKVTVRSSGYQDKTTELFVRGGQVRRQVFKLQPKNSAPTRLPATAPSVQTPVSRAPATTTAVAQRREVQRGGLQVNIVSAETGQGLLADIAIYQPNGREVRRSSQVSSVRYDLPPQELIVRVNYGGLVTNQKVKIRSGKLAIKTIRFK